MFIVKKKYYLFIENTSEIDISKIKVRNKFVIIYRSFNKEKISTLVKFVKKCEKAGVKFLISNDFKLSSAINAHGIYISAKNKSYKHLIYCNKKIVVGGAHTVKEVYLKKKQNCSEILLSRIFKTSYKNKRGFLGVVKFNILSNDKNLTPLGGIRLKNLNLLRIVRTDSMAIFSEIKKKPAIISRLF